MKKILGFALAAAILLATSKDVNGAGIPALTLADSKKKQYETNISPGNVVVKGFSCYKLDNQSINGHNSPYWWPLLLKGEKYFGLWKVAGDRLPTGQDWLDAFNGKTTKAMVLKVVNEKPDLALNYFAPDSYAILTDNKGTEYATSILRENTYSSYLAICNPLISSSYSQSWQPITLAIDGKVDGYLASGGAVRTMEQWVDLFKRGGGSQANSEAIFKTKDYHGPAYISTIPEFSGNAILTDGKGMQYATYIKDCGWGNWTLTNSKIDFHDCRTWKRVALTIDGKPGNYIAYTNRRNTRPEEWVSVFKNGGRKGSPLYEIFVIFKIILQR